MILFMAKPNDIKNFEHWLDVEMDSKDKKRLFPKPGEYEILLAPRDFPSIPLVTEVDQDGAIKHIKDGYIIKYVVK